MKKFRNNITVNAIIIFSILSHVTLIHTFAKDLVVCLNEENGNVKIEKINDCEECKIPLEVLYNSSLVEKSISDIDCEDIPLDEFCFEENQLMPKIDILFWKLLVKTIMPDVTEYDTLKYFIADKTFNFNLTLENYTSVLLLI